MNKQREIIYDERRRVLHGEDLRNHIFSMLEELVDENIDFCTSSSKYAEEWDIAGLYGALRKICGSLGKLQYDDVENLDKQTLKDDVMALFEAAYETKEQEIGIDRMRELERMLLIRVVDNKWMDHIDAMDQLRHGIGLRALGQQDPATAYQNEGFEMFELMIKVIKEDLVKYCFNVTLQTNTNRKQVIGGGMTVKEDYVDDSQIGASSEGDSFGSAAGDIPAAAAVPPREQRREPVTKEETVGRNDPCPCGSGKKYKKCCGQ